MSEAALHADSGPRLLACDWLADTTTPQEIRYKYGNILLEDRSPLVRARAFWLIANADPKKFLTQIEHALMDPSASVQDTARGAWRMLLQRDAGGITQCLTLFFKRGREFADQPPTLNLCTSRQGIAPQSSSSRFA